MSAQCTIQVVTTDITEETCIGSSDASATAVAAGSGSINYLWSDGQTTATATNLTTGNYTVTATDGVGCTGTASVEVLLNPEGVWLMFSFTPVTCNGGNDGTAHVSVMTGVAPYTYIWNDPAGTTNADPVNLSAGQYTVTVTDSNGCSNYGPVTITEPTAIVIISSTTNEACFGDADGTASVSVSGGTPGYTYLWSNGQTTETAINLTAGDYTVTVIDANDCPPSTITVTVGLTNPQIVISSTSILTACTGGNNGSITATVNSSGGSFLWSNGGIGATISNLIAGDYTITFTGAGGCIAIATVSVLGDLTTSGAGTNATVSGGNDGTATVTATGGTPGYTYLWSNGQTTPTVTGLIAGTYTVTVTDSNTSPCTATATIVINEPPTLTITPTPDTCELNVGTVTVTATGGTPGYTYLWSNGATTQTIINLNAGDYTVTVTDAIGLTSSISTTVTEEGSTIIATTSHSNETCVGSSDGQVAVSTSGGVGLMTFLWSNGATTFIVNNLSVGTYTVTVTDEIGCTASSTETIELSPEGVWVDITVTHVSCFNGDNGSATAVVNTGVAPYTYTWSNGGDTPTISNLTAGDYTISVTDVNGCIGIFTTTITQPTELIATTTSTNTTCALATGTAMVTATGGTQDYTYLWNNGQTTQNIIGLLAGTYTATVTDANGCTAVSSTTITDMDLVIVTTVSTTDPSGPGASDGAIDIEVGGGSSYTYSWSNGATTQDIMDLMAGCYTVTVTDGSGVCAAIDTICIGCMLNLNVMTTNNDCINTNIGTATATVTSNCSITSYTYNWTTGTGVSVGTTQTISDLLDGTYLVTVTDANGFTVTGSGVVTGSGGITSTANGTNVICNGDGNGTATGNGLGGSSTFTYMWSNNEITQTITNLTAGIYTVTVTDESTTCTSVSQVTITEPPVITITASTSSPTTTGGSDGSVDLTVTGGTSPYTYLWSNGATTENISGLIVGCYTVTVTDSNDCTATEEYCINPPCTISATTVGTNPSVAGGSDGSIDLTVTGGTLPFTYLWSNGETTEDIFNLSQGCYTVTVIDAGSCIAISQACIDDPNPLSCLLTVTSTPESCNPGSDGTAMASVIGCTPPVSYVWENNSGAVVGNTAMIMNLTSGMYYVTITDANLETRNDSVEVTFVGGIDANASSENVTCNSFTDGEVNATPTGGTDPYSYNWAGANGTIGNTDTIFNLSAGTYTVTVTDAVGCTDVEEVEILEDDPITLTQIITPLNCFGDTNASITVTPSGGVPNYSYQWSTSPTDIVDSIAGLSSGVYTVTITDQNMCMKVDSFMINEPPAVTITADPDTSICENFLIVNATSSAGASISWYNEDNVLIGTGSPFAYLDISSGTSTIYAEANANGCTGVDSITVTQNAIDISVTPDTSVCLGDVTQLMATNNIPSQDVDYLWTPTNLFVIDTDTLATPILVTSDTGTFEVYLYSINEFNCEQFDTVTVSVQDTTTNFIIKQQCIGLEVNYTSASGTEMIWNFGDGSVQDTAISTTHTYMSANDYTVLMILPPGTMSAACLPDTVTQVVPVADDPIFDTGFTLEYDPCIEGSTMVIFTDTSTNIFGPIDSVWWVWQGDTISTNPQDSMLITQSVMDSLTLYVMSEDGCVDSLSKEIEINVINVILSDTIIVCIGVDTFLNPNGNPNYQYTWAPAPNGDPNEFNPMITPTVSTSYSVTITDNSGTNPCPIIKEVFVFVPTLLTDIMVTSDPDSILCEEGVIMLEASSFSTNTYKWYDDYPNGSIMSNSSIYNLEVNNMLEPQYYYVEAIDQYGCPTVDSIFAGSAEIIMLLDTDVEICIGDSLNILGGAVSNGEIMLYEWLDPNGMVVGMGSTLAIVPSVSGNYTVNISNEYGCELMQSFNVAVIDISSEIQAEADPDTIILGEITNLDVRLDYPMKEYKYSWSPIGTLDDSTSQSPVAMPEVTTDYYVTVTEKVNDSLSCSTVSNVLVTVLDICDRPYVFFPNVFSPNGDDINDVLKVESEVVDEVYFVIYNRWGEKVFEGHNVNSAWDGTHNGKPVSSDVYGFYLRARCVNGKVYEEKGNVTVLR